MFSPHADSPPLSAKVVLVAVDALVARTRYGKGAAAVALHASVQFHRRRSGRLQGSPFLFFFFLFAFFFIGIVAAIIVRNRHQLRQERPRGMELAERSPPD